MMMNAIDNFELKKPKRSLNAYNLFFAHVRQRIVESEDNEMVHHDSKVDDGHVQKGDKKRPK